MTETFHAVESAIDANHHKDDQHSRKEPAERSVLERSPEIAEERGQHASFTRTVGLRKERDLLSGAPGR